MTEEESETATDQHVALITGSGRKRIGNIVAHWLAKRGYDIALHYFSSREDAVETQQEIQAAGVQCEVFQTNVGKESEVETLTQQVFDRFGRVDVLVNTSSIWNTKSFDDLTADDLRRNFDINALGTFLCSRSVGLRMVEQETGGTIVTIGDWAIERPYLDHAAYFVSKGTIPTMTRVLAVELGSRNPKVRVNCIHPGPVMFPENAGPQERQELIDSTLVKNADCPESIAQAVEFLIDNHFVTGIELPVDGGRTIFASDQSIRNRST